MKKALVISGTSTIGTEMIKQMQQEYTQIIVTGRNQKSWRNCDYSFLRFRPCS